MCGVVAIVGRHGQPISASVLEHASAALVHRGPDDAGQYLSGAVGFGFRRLAVIDLSPAGHQPMSTADGELTIVFNGEIYNYVELRRELITLGHAFRSASDTEVLLAAYRQWGADCVHRFNGMWAFLIHDRRDHSIFGARDRLGVKPLYLWQDADWLVLASEPRAIGATGLCPLRPDWTRFADAIRWDQMDHGDRSTLAGIGQVPAGHSFRISAHGRLVLQRYWEPPSEPDATADRPEADWIEELGALATDAVRLRLRSDVPVGFTLSGGIDSSLLICEAAQLGAGNGGLLAFSYQDSRFDERGPISDTVSHTGALTLTLDEKQLDLAALLPEVVMTNGEPVHSPSAVANYALFGLARRHGVKVVLGGQGADEVFGGYSTFERDYWHTLFEDRRWSALLGDVRASARLQGGVVAATLIGSLKRSLRIALSDTPAYRYLRERRAVPPRSTELHSVFAHDFLRLATPPSLARSEFRIAGSQRRALAKWPLPMYLRIEDRVSMAHSVEARLPFTDYRLVEHALRMPDSLRFAGGLNKVALRRVAARRVPHSVVSQVRKLGFPVGESDVAARGLHDLCRKLAASRAFRERDLYDHRAVTSLLARAPQARDVDTLFHLAQTELWLSGLDGREGAS